MPKVSTVTDHSSHYGAKRPGLRGLFRLLPAAALTGALPLEASFGLELAGRASVIDADTIEIHGQRIRLHGVDAPEKGQPCSDAAGRPYRCGTIAARALDQFIGASPVTCRERDTDRYGRTVANCSVRGEDIELWLVRNGYAMAYRRYSSDYIGAEQEAKNNRRGIWSGSLTPPWEWRKQQRESHTEPPHP